MCPTIYTLCLGEEEPWITLSFFLLQLLLPGQTLLLSFFLAKKWHSSIWWSVWTWVQWTRDSSIWSLFKEPDLVTRPCDMDSLDMLILFVLNPEALNQLHLLSSLLSPLLLELLQVLSSFLVARLLLFPLSLRRWRMFASDRCGLLGSLDKLSQEYLYLDT